MTERIEINLERTGEGFEDYEREDKNLLVVRVHALDGTARPSPAHQVSLTLSPEGMIGLGTELLRAAYGKGKTPRGTHWHLTPGTADSAVQQLGVYLHPSSCELVVQIDDLGTVEDALGSAEQTPSQ